MLNLDTHIVVGACTGRLSAEEQELLNNNDACISAMVLWELCKLYQLGRISIAPTDPVLTEVLKELIIYPMDMAVCLAATKLDFRSDPADEVIAATSIVHRAPLVTRDAKLRGSTLVPLAL